MPDQKISQLTAGGAAQATDLLPVARSGTNVSLLAKDIATALERLAASGQSLTGSQATSLVDLAATWNTTGTPTAIKLNVTDTASNANSLLMDLQVGGSSRFRVAKDGITTIANAAGMGNGTVSVGSASNTLTLYDSGILSWSASSGVSANAAAGDTRLQRDLAANTLAQRNSTNAQTFRLYTRYDTASDFRRLSLTSATFGGVEYSQILAETGGTYASSNVGIVLAPKGTGAFSLQMPDGTTAGGNARGANAVDLQMVRSAATNVASAASAFVVGENCTASSTRAIAMGLACTASGGQSVAIGNNCSATSSNTFATNESATASAQAGFAANVGAVAAAYGAAAFGHYSNADKRGQFAVGVGFFGATGDAQWSVVGLRGSTTNATVTEIFVVGTTNQRATVPASTTWMAEVDVIARSTGGTDNACFQRRCIIKRDGANNTALVGTVQTIGTDIGSNAGAPPTGWAVTVTADDTNEALKLEVTGAASTTIRWVAKVSLVEVGLA